MLKRRHPTSLIWGVLLFSLLRSAHAQEGEEERSLRRPQRLTTSSGDQFLGQLAAGGNALYFLSNRNTTTEPFVQDLEDGRARRLFDEGADITWPRRGPRDAALLYISYRDSAGGQLCVRDLPSGENRRCLDDSLSALQAEWIDERRVLLLARASVQDDLQVLEVRVDAKLSARHLMQRNMSGPAISPDGRWLVYLPLERTARVVGPGFAAQASPRLEALRLDRPAPPVPLVPDLPGRVGQPAFSGDGHLYFVQFFSDSNEDGVIDAGDRGVLFRVTFPVGRDDAPAVAAADMPEQLTDASWNCQYPAPAEDRLIATCAREGNLDVYELPLEGEVPVQWRRAELTGAIKAANRRSDQLLLWRHRLTREEGGAGKRFVTMRLVMTHLELEDFDAAEFYAKHLGKLGDKAAVELSAPWLVFVEHRRAVRNRELGRRVGGFADAERARMDALAPKPTDSRAVAFLGYLIRSEIAEALGDYARARAELEAASVAAAERVPRALLEQYARRADALYRLLGDRDALVRVLRQLAQHTAFSTEDQLDFARAAGRAVARGRPVPEADAALAKVQAEAPAGSELAFAMELARAVLAIRVERPPSEVRDRLLALFQREERMDRRRSVVMDAVKKASALGADGIIERLAEAYLEASQRGAAEWRMAVRLYRRAIVGRAYRRLARGRNDQAKADFDAVTQKTGSYESLVAAIDVRLRGGMEPPEVEAELAGWRAQLSEPQRAFLKAYLIERRIWKLKGEEHAAALKTASGLLRAHWSELKLQRSARALSGVIHHETYLVTGNQRSAERANSQYQVALELVGRDLRYRATLLGAMGLLQAGAGNYRLALSYLEQREKLPYTDGTKGLSVRLARAKALLHAGREGEAADAAERALALLDEQPKLERFRALVWGRVALYSLAAGRYERAIAAYDVQLPLLQGPEAGRNRLYSHLGRSGAALGAGQPARALEDLAQVEQALVDPSIVAGLSWSFASPEQVLRDYRLLSAGMRASAHRQLGNFAAAGEALETRRKLLLARFAHSQREETLRQIIEVEAALAINAADRKDAQAAARWIDESLRRSDDLLKRLEVTVEPAALDALWLASQLQFAKAVPAREDLPGRLREALKVLAERHDPAWRSYQGWFEIYLALLSPGPAAP